MTPAHAITAYLNQTSRRVAEMWTTTHPTTSVTIPHFDKLLAAAAKIDSSQPETSAYIASVISGLLGRAGATDNETPPPTLPVFPTDHSMHLTMGAEWYWIGANLNVVNTADSTDTGRIAVLYSIQRERAVGLTAQQLANWSDTAAQITSSIGTLTVDTTANQSYHRRLPNIQWPAVGGDAAFSAPGDPLLFKCGTDKISGSVDVLPLEVTVDDGQMQINLTLKNPRMPAANAFFLQGGVPTPGTTPNPTPGIYYSWPQLDVSGTITVGGQTYRVTGGPAWMDHQLMARSLINNNNDASPLPFIDDPKPYNGWSWQYFNLHNGDAFTLASFQTGELNKLPPVFYGFYLTPASSGSGWTSSPLFGSMALEDFKEFPTDAGGGPPSQGTTTTTAKLPTSWKYLLFSTDPTPLALVASTTAWSSSGTFNNANGSLASELPVDLIDLSIGPESSHGSGFGETIGFEPVAQSTARALTYLDSIIAAP